jgi:hypothetical protein
MLFLYVCRKCFGQGLLLLEDSTGQKRRRFVFSQAEVALAIREGQRIAIIEKDEAVDVLHSEAIKRLPREPPVAVQSVERNDLHTDIVEQCDNEELTTYFSDQLKIRECGGIIKYLR